MPWSRFLHAAAPVDSSIPLEPLRKSRPPSSAGRPTPSEALTRLLQARRIDQGALGKRLKRAYDGEMKYSTQLLFNAQPEWAAHYLGYDELKAAIYKFERERVNDVPTEVYSDDPVDCDLESAALLGASERTPAEKLFIRLLDKELANVVDFYAEKERDLLGELHTTLSECARLEADGVRYDEDDDDDLVYDSDDDSGDEDKTKRTGTVRTTPRKRRRRAMSEASQASGSGSKDGDLIGLHGAAEEAIPEESELAPLRRPLSTATGTSLRRRSVDAHNVNRASIFNSSAAHDRDTVITFKLRLQAHYRDLTHLQNFVETNHTGFRKALKKFDKVMDCSIKDQYMTNVVEKAFPFQATTRERIRAAIDSITPHYAQMATQGDEAMAAKQLRVQLREQVVYERNTVWRDLIGLERKGWSKRAMDKPVVQPQEADDKGPTVIQTPAGRLRLPAWVTKEAIGGAVGVGLFIGILNSTWLPRIEERNCLAMLAFCTVFWAFEVIPLFVTSLLVPFLAVTLRIIRSTDGEDRRLSAHDATQYIFSQMFSPTIMLLLGGFTLAAALSKHQVDRALATRVLRLAGTSPRRVLLAYMFVAGISSAVISNVAAPVLCFSLIQPILRTLPPRSSYAKAIILGIALASNVGGMASPISSPQNLIAVDYADPALSWGEWLPVSFFVCTTSIAAIWVILLFSYPIEKNTVINQTRAPKERFNASQWFVCAISALTIGMWCASKQLAPVLGDMGVTAFIPIVAFYGTGILRKSDFENYPWAIVFLAMGGIGLGKAVLSSGLLGDLDTFLESRLHDLDIWTILLCFTGVCLVLATCISHTVASVLVVPIAARIGNALEDPHPRLLIMATAFICSAGMGLPVSGFPNMTAINLEDDLGVRYLEVYDFLRNGIPASLVSGMIIVTVGYVAMRLEGL